MTFKEAYNLVNKKKLVVVYTLKWQQNANSDMPQDMSDLTIHQDVICAAKIEEQKYDILEEMGLPSTLTEIVLLDSKNNEIARGEANETRCCHVFLSLDELMEELRMLLNRDLGAWMGYAIDE